MPALLKEKEKGKIRHLGITETSPHDHDHDMLARAVGDGVWETAMLGFNMMPASWLVAIAVGFVLGVVLLSRWREGPKRRKKWLLVTWISFATAVGFYVCAVWYAHEGCSSSADGFCVFSGFPYLSVSALALMIAVVNWLLIAGTMRITRVDERTS